MGAMGPHSHGPCRARSMFRMKGGTPGWVELPRWGVPAVPHVDCEDPGSCGCGQGCGRAVPAAAVQGADPASLMCNQGMLLFNGGMTLPNEGTHVGEASAAWKRTKTVMHAWEAKTGGVMLE